MQTRKRERETKRERGYCANRRKKEKESERMRKSERVRE